MISQTRTARQGTPFLVPILNPVIKGLLHLRIPMGPMALLTVEGRKTGKKHATPIAVLKLDEKQYLVSVYGLSGWVRNLRATRHAGIIQGWHSRKVEVVELNDADAAPVLKHAVSISPSFLRKYFKPNTAESSLGDFEKDAYNHPVFLLKE